MAVVLPGGFDTILAQFSVSGTFLTENDDGAGVATDPSTGLAGDARMTATLTPGPGPNRTGLDRSKEETSFVRPLSGLLTLFRI